MPGRSSHSPKTHASIRFTTDAVRIDHLPPQPTYLASMKITRSEFGCSIATPSGALPIRQVLGIGMNYAAHAAEQGAKTPERPVVFSKAAFAVVPTGSPIRVPKVCQDQAQVDFEGELVVVIGTDKAGKLCREVPKERALEFVLGYAAGNDVSARWWQKQGSGGQFNRGKSFDTFAPMSDLAPAASVPNPGSLRLVTKVNGSVMQDSSTADLIFDIPTLIADLSRGWTLVPGTAIFTGTPSGVGMARNPQVFLKHGDSVEVTIEGVGSVSSHVEFE